MSTSTTPGPHPTSNPDDRFVEVYYYPGLQTKHKLGVVHSDTFLDLKMLLHPETNIHYNNQKLIYRGLVPKDDDTMEMHDVGSGRFRVARVRVKTKEEYRELHEEGRKREETESKALEEGKRKRREAHLADSLTRASGGDYYG